MRQGHRRQALIIAGIVGLLLVAYFLRGHGASSNPVSRSTTAAASSGSFVTGPRVTPVPGASLRIVGLVRDARGPVAGVSVSASRVEMEETLSERSCPPSYESPKVQARLTDCWNAANEELLEQVSARQGEARILAEATTEEDGTFMLDGLPEGTVTLWALGHEGAAKVHDVATGRQDVVLALEDGHVFEGIVVQDVRNREPIAGAQVTVFSHEHTRFFDATSDARGRFRIGPLPSAEYALLATADGRSPRLLREANPLDSEWILLGHPSRYAGQVVSAQGSPAPGVHVRMLSPFNDLATYGTTTDAQGRFDFRVAGTHVNKLFARTAEQDAFATVDTGPREDLVLTLEPGVLLQGTVRDDAGRPIEGARLSATPMLMLDEESASEGRRAVTDSSGHYQLGPLLAVRTHVMARADRHLMGSSVLHLPDKDTGPLDFTLPRAICVEGVLVDEEGQPLAHKELRLRQGPMTDPQAGDELAVTRTDDAGRFSLDAETGGPGWIDVYDSDFLPERLAVTIPSQEVRMVMHRGASVSITVRNAAGAPLDDLAVTLWKRDARNWSERAGRTDEQGRVTLRGLKPGPYVVEAVNPTRDVDQRTSRPLDIMEGVNPEVALRMEEGRTLRGVVVDTRGQPLAGAAIRARVPDGDTPHYRARTGDDYDLEGLETDEPRGVLTDDEGRFTLRHLSGPRHELWVELEDHRVEPSRCQGVTSPRKNALRVGSDVDEVRLVLRRTPHVRGKVVAEGGEALQTFEVNGHHSRWPDGRFELTVEEQGAWRLRVEAPDFAPLERTLTLDDTDVDLGVLTLTQGRTVRVLLRDAETGAPFNGRLHADSGSKVAVAVTYRIRAEGELEGPPYPDKHRVVPELDGTLLMKHLPATAFTVELEAPTFLPLHRSVGAQEETFTASLGRGARVSGHVRDAQGRPAHAKIVFWGPDGNRDERFPPPGDFSFRAVPPGIYTASAYPVEDSDPLFFPNRSVTIPPTGEVTLTFDAAGARVTLALRTVGDIDTVLLIPGQVPLPTSAKAAERLEIRQHPFKKWEGLSLIYRGVPAGHYTLLGLNRAKDRIHREELDVPAEGTPSHDVRPVWSPLAP
ncbi:carboxypeptidase-like regulatory domain-containing protein [Corallococcus sp. bb12-1]|uniref:carboxypeptidase-like regulatory domain-containing protein n=1 Tax=Corallococcus sp. bb12-1 TaxID=2996784 RepID=UPI002270AD6E|nr:carboxypeptidase-like regulatory domain-containing protein [Corallococcus sp. bb12-1]MCY1043825.1 carboxypeptidase-like regulatory domain-containing protein [Corallococcus sp. bb12-1]